VTLSSNYQRRYNISKATNNATSTSFAVSWLTAGFQVTSHKSLAYRFAKEASALADVNQTSSSIAYSAYANIYVQGSEGRFASCLDCALIGSKMFGEISDLRRKRESDAISIAVLILLGRYNDALEIMPALQEYAPGFVRPGAIG
jgi:hypothetical protein